MKKKIVLASGNKHKLIEISEILTDFEIVSCKDLGFNEDIVEDGSTFYENALIKAKTVSEALGIPALADDSGICVKALNDGPGIYSARYSKEGTDEANLDFLLENMKGVTDREAKYVCCLVYYDNGKIVTATGETYGKILYEREGSSGFGYDPIFYSDDLKKSIGLSTPEEKNKISHRYRALKELKEKL